jgi:ribosome-associated heat shock protein Hsp15
MDEGREIDGWQRIDKWLWHGRFVKTRGIASRLVADGKIRVNRERVVKPSQMVQPGDVITAALAGRVRVVKVLMLADRRGPPAEARTLYEDLLAGKSNGTGKADTPE